MVKNTLPVAPARTASLTDLRRWPGDGFFRAKYRSRKSDLAERPKSEIRPRSIPKSDFRPWRGLGRLEASMPGRFAETLDSGPQDNWIFFHSCPPTGQLELFFHSCPPTGPLDFFFTVVGLDDNLDIFFLGRIPTLARARLEASMPGRWRGRASMPGRNVALGIEAGRAIKRGWASQYSLGEPVLIGRAIMQKNKLFHMSCKNRAKPCKKQAVPHVAKTMQKPCKMRRVQSANPAEPSQSPASLLHVLYVLYGSHKASHSTSTLPGSLLYVLYVLYGPI